ncbi:HD domain-containing protein [Adhaeretor mobilis]|uniref:HD domain protein n=1 Tax=Adhaeretor mobilis TaxID=1930276 RepID=A0A517MUI5_9BACT|nr:HD domain-containing protein [Adhaeretor mobilis]QDS98536.1 HD domain protein [Adhaeretor mobilis]
MNGIDKIPEVVALRGGSSVIRIPPETDVPVTPRVQRLIDTAPFRRLASISQLGLVGHVYPAARHSRFEHSLGVYRTALQFLDRLCRDERFCKVVDEPMAERFLVAALLHDLGHWPFCHPIEDIGLKNLPSHEEAAATQLEEAGLTKALKEDWGISPGEILHLLSGKPRNAAERTVGSMLSGPIDVDKIDYLRRDSLHAGVPYGQNFDSRRLMQSLCMNESGEKIAISTKGKTAAEMMVFARYVMFSEVYWHHAVRSATAMLQRGYYEAREHAALKSMLTLTDSSMTDALLAATAGTPSEALIDGLFGPQRRLYKRVAQYSSFDSPELFQKIAHQPFSELVKSSQRLAERLSSKLGCTIEPHELLIDAPPVELEVQFEMEVFDAKSNSYRRLGDISPVVRTLAKEQFDDHVKMVRLFVHPRLAEEVRGCGDLPEILGEVVEG